MIRLVKTKLSIGDHVYCLTYSDKIVDGIIGEIQISFHENRTMSIYYGIKVAGLVFTYSAEKVFAKLDDAIKYKDEQERIKLINNGKSTE